MVKGKVVAKTLNDFLEPEKEDVMTLLLEHIDASRLDRSTEIKDIEVIELSTNKIIADVRGYSVYIDIEKQFMLHDCGDWIRTQRDGRFCKHIGALMLALPEDAARGVLLGIKRDKWEFSRYTGIRDNSQCSKNALFRSTCQSAIAPENSQFGLHQFRK